MRYCLIVLMLLANIGRADNLQDIRDWQKGLPIAGVWYVEGATPKWQCDQIKEGHRLLPAIRLPQTFTEQSVNNAGFIKNYMALLAPELTYINNNNLPFCLRTNNVHDVFYGDKIFRSPPVPTIDQIPIVYHGTEDERIADPLSPSVHWEFEGTRWGNSLFIKAMQDAIKTPPWYMTLENNEASEATAESVIQLKSRNWLFRDPVTITKNQRALDLLKGYPEGTNPEQAFVDYATRRRDKIKLLWASFDKQLASGWSGKMLTGAYGNIPDGEQISAKKVFFEPLGYADYGISYDGSSPSIYINAGNPLWDFTSLRHTFSLNWIPAWDFIRNRNPKAFREISVQVTNGALLTGARNGKHEVITPERWGGYIQWIMWAQRMIGAPLSIRDWQKYNTPPTTPMFSATDIMAGGVLDQFGYPELKTATVETYFKPVMEAVDRICDDPTLREFWLKGEPVYDKLPIVDGSPGVPSDLFARKYIAGYLHHPSDMPDKRWRLLTCDVNDTPDKWKYDSDKGKLYIGSIKVWGVATRLKNRFLIFAYTPCKLEGQITFTIPGITEPIVLDAPKPWAYWVISPRIEKILP